MGKISLLKPPCSYESQRSPQPAGEEHASSWRSDFWRRAFHTYPQTTITGVRNNRQTSRNLPAESRSFSTNELPGTITVPSQETITTEKINNDGKPASCCSQLLIFPKSRLICAEWELSQRISLRITRKSRVTAAHHQRVLTTLRSSAWITQLICTEEAPAGLLAPTQAVLKRPSCVRVVQ